MKSSISFFLVIICTVVLAAQQSQAKKGCNAYGHACYGGHGKRSLGSLIGNNNLGSVAAAASSNNIIDNDEIRPDAIYQLYPNEATILADNEIEAIPKYRLIKIMKSWLNGRSRRPSERLSEADYSLSGEIFNRDNIN